MPIIDVKLVKKKKQLPNQQEIYLVLTTLKRENWFYPAFWKKLLSSSHLYMGKHPPVKPNISLAFKTKGVQGCRLSSLPYMSLSCKVPPNLIFKDEKAAKHSKAMIP